MKTIYLSAVLLIGSASFAQVGIGTTSPNSTLDVRGSLSANYKSFSLLSRPAQQITPWPSRVPPLRP